MVDRDRLRATLRRVADLGSTLSANARDDVEAVARDVLRPGAGTPRERAGDLIEDLRARTRRSAGEVAAFVRDELRDGPPRAPARRLPDLGDAVERAAAVVADLLVAVRSRVDPPPTRAAPGPEPQPRAPARPAPDTAPASGAPEAQAPAKKAPAKKAPAATASAKKAPAKKAPAAPSPAAKAPAAKAPAAKAPAKKAPSGRPPAGGAAGGSGRTGDSSRRPPAAPEGGGSAPADDGRGG